MPVFGICSFTFSSMPSSCASVTCVSSGRRRGERRRTQETRAQARPRRCTRAAAHRLRYLAALRHGDDHVLHAARLLGLDQRDARHCGRNAPSSRGCVRGEPRVSSGGARMHAPRPKQPDASTCSREAVRPVPRRKRSCGSQHAGLLLRRAVWRARTSLARFGSQHRGEHGAALLLRRAGRPRAARSGSARTQTRNRRCNACCSAPHRLRSSSACTSSWLLGTLPWSANDACQACVRATGTPRLHNCTAAHPVLLCQPRTDGVHVVRHGTPHTSLGARIELCRWQAPPACFAPVRRRQVRDAPPKPVAVPQRHPASAAGAHARPRLATPGRRLRQRSGARLQCRPRTASPTTMTVRARADALRRVVPAA